MKIVLTGTMALALSAGTALAADLPSRVAPPVYVAPAVEVPFSWTGFQAGLHSAYTFSSENHVRTTGVGTPAGDIRPSYVTTVRDNFAEVGGELAYNYELTSGFGLGSGLGFGGAGSGVVIGVAADADWAHQRKDTFIFTGGGNVSDYHQSLEWLGTANGRLGYAFGRFLVYGTGGFAYGDPGYGASFLTPPAVRYYGGNNAGLKGGYDFGGGAAYAIPNDSFLNKFAIEKMLGFDKFIPGLSTASTVLQVEFVHYDLGSQNIALGSTGVAGATGSYNLRFHSEGNQVRAGLLYLFGGAPSVPVVARY